MDAQLVVTFVLFNAGAYLLAFCAGTALVDNLARPWRRSVGAHWSERARLAFAPGFAVLVLAGVLPAVVALIGGVGLAVSNPRAHEQSLGFSSLWLASFAGLMTARYRWLSCLWGPRVTLRSWLAGCFVVLFALMPHLLVALSLLFLLPETPGAGSAAVLAAGVVAVAFFVFGGGVLLLRLLRVVKPAAPRLSEMVQQLAQKMKVPGWVKVFEIEWAQANAVAWQLHRAVGFSRALLEVMTDDEVRAIAAHELAHLVEPPWVRGVRMINRFAYLVPVPIIKYGGNSGALAGWLLFLGITLGYQRFTRRMEERADRLESEAIADADTYTRSMIKLHEANMAPAVMPGAQTHPHLYDRLLAGGIQPEFPRPPAPSRAKPLLAVLATVLSVAVVMFLMVVAAAVTQHWIKAGLKQN